MEKAKGKVEVWKSYVKGKAKITDYLKAGYSHFYVQTEEMDRAVDLILKEVKSWKDAGQKVWSIGPDKCGGCGKIVPAGVDYAGCPKCGSTAIEISSDPLIPLTELEAAPVNTVTLLKNYHWFMKDEATKVSNYDTTQFIQDRLKAFRAKEKRKVIIVVAPVPANAGLPKELIREFVPLKFALPDEDEIREVLKYTIMVAKNNEKFKQPNGEETESLVQAAKGMGLQEIENAYFYSVVKTGGRLDPKVVTDQKMRYLEEAAGVKYVEYKETFSSLLGYDSFKAFGLMTAKNPKSKGVLILGPAGVGKSHFVKALAGEVGIPMITVEMAEWFTSGYGETGQRVLRFVDSVLAIGRAIVFIDEIEKALAGTQGGQGANAGHEETQRAMAPFLKLLSDRPDGLYFAATCNDIRGIPSAYVRAERWDGVVFMDLPDEQQRLSILEYYKKEYGVGGNPGDMDGWSGAEIKTCCRLAHIMETNLNKSSKFVVPVSKTMDTEISHLRAWAKGRTIPASEVKVNGGSNRRSIEL